MANDWVAALLRRVGRPVVRYFDNRFQDVHVRIIDTGQGAAPGLREDDQDLLQQVQMDAVSTAETVSGLATSIDRRLARFVQEQHDADPRHVAPLGLYRPDVIRFLNWVLSFDGPVAERSLLINHPLTVLFNEDGPFLAQVNERIVEVPFALGVAGSLAPGSSVVDVGAAESTLALSLASRGYRTFALDPRPYPFDHPNLTSVVSEVADWKPDAGVDLVLAVSAVEHFGLRGYGAPPSPSARATHSVASGPAVDLGEDREAMDTFRSWLSPSGRLVLTVPTGPPSTDDFQRVYDAPRLAELTTGWTVERLEHALQVDATTWEPASGPPAEGRGVAMMVLS